MSTNINVHVIQKNTLILRNLTKVETEGKDGEKDSEKMLISIFLISCTMLFAGCGEKHSEYEESESSQTEESDDLITVGFAQSGSGATWNAANIDSIKQNCSEENGIRLILENANDSLDNQIASIRSFIEQDVDVIGFSPLVSDGWDDVLREAKAAGIPVILVDRTLNTSDDTLYTCWVDSDFLLEGYKAADWIIEYMKTNHTGTEKIKVALFQGTIGASAEVGRTQGVEEMLRNAGNYTTRFSPLQVQVILLIQSLYLAHMERGFPLPERLRMDLSIPFRLLFLNIQKKVSGWGRMRSWTRNSILTQIAMQLPMCSLL